jgi:hypothetical protein
MIDLSIEIQSSIEIDRPIVELSGSIIKMDFNILACSKLCEK